MSNLSLNEDFNRIWYRNVSPVFTNYIIIDAIFTWGFFIFYKCISNKEGLKSDEGSILQKSMNEKITSWKLNAYVEYSYFNLIVFMSLFYCCGIPVLLPLAFANLFSKYVTNRSLVQNNSSKIEGLSEKFNSFPLSLLPFLLIFASCFGSWMLTAIDSIYPNALQITIDFGFNCESTNTICNIFNRQMYLPFFIFLAALVLFYFLFYNLVVRFCSFLASLCYEKKKVTHPYHTLEYSHYAKSMSVLTSYNIRNNPKYKNVIINLERYLEKDEKY